MSIESPGKKKPDAIRPAQVRYIKLGAGGEWEDECIAKGIIRFGFGSKRPERFPLSGLKKAHLPSVLLFLQILGFECRHPVDVFGQFSMQRLC
jgi:hypothetical protein